MIYWNYVQHWIKSLKLGSRDGPCFKRTKNFRTNKTDNFIMKWLSDKTKEIEENEQ